MENLIAILIGALVGYGCYYYLHKQMWKVCFALICFIIIGSICVTRLTPELNKPFILAMIIALAVALGIPLIKDELKEENDSDGEV